MNHKISAKAAKVSEIQTVDKRKCREIASGGRSQKRLAECTSATKGEHLGKGVETLLGKTRKDHWISGCRVPGTGLVLRSRRDKG